MRLRWWSASTLSKTTLVLNISITAAATPATISHRARRLSRESGRNDFRMAHSPASAPTTTVARDIHTEVFRVRMKSRTAISMIIRNQPESPSRNSGKRKPT